MKTGQGISRFMEEGLSADFEGEYDPVQLKMGIEVEMEHTTDPAVAEKIAKDHLAEIPDYYTRLKKMEEDYRRGFGEKFSAGRFVESLERIRSIEGRIASRREKIETDPCLYFNESYGENLEFVKVVPGVVTLSMFNRFMDKCRVEANNFGLVLKGEPYVANYGKGCMMAWAVEGDIEELKEKFDYETYEN